MNKYDSVFFENGHGPSLEDLRKEVKLNIYGSDQPMKLMDDIKENILNNEIEKIKEERIQYLNKTIFADKTADQGWINTFYGKKFFPFNPKIEDIDINDIAHSLSRLCRFTGHLNKEHYSVAEHSVLVSFLCNEEDAKYGLLHDGSEAYLQDLPSPLKRSGKFEEYKKCEKNLQSMIYEKFGLSNIEPASVKNADLRALSTEAVNLFDNMHEDWKLPCSPVPIKIQGFGPNKAKQLFLDRYYELFGRDDVFNK